MSAKSQFTFEISLSVLNHLGRNLYRSFATVLGEAISNAWDADAKNVWIHLDRDKHGFTIKDDGVGMTDSDFQNKFLKIGYSKRKDGVAKSPSGRPFIGRKGIGKLALLSCAQEISIITKKSGGRYVGGKIVNAELDEAITEDLTPQEYPLGNVVVSSFRNLTTDHAQGTIIRFEQLHDGVRRSFDFLSKTIALNFRFSLLDPSFSIYLDGEKITHEHLRPLAEKTEFLWKFGGDEDPYVTMVEELFAQAQSRHESGVLNLPGVTGFVASVVRPINLKIATTDERVGIDLFVNGRLRERAITKHVPTARIPESYLYGQIHFNSLDDKVDRFTSSREGIVADDPKFDRFLQNFKARLLEIFEQWDEWRRKHRQSGDADNMSITPTARASAGLFNAVADSYGSSGTSKRKDKVDQWVDELHDDAVFNFESYAECFIAENLIRRYIVEQGLALSEEAKAQAEEWKKAEKRNKNAGNISIRIRRTDSDISYLSMDALANLVDKPTDRIKQAALARDATEFKPIRDALAHTALLTDEAKSRLRAVRENVKARIKTLLSPET